MRWTNVIIRSNPTQEQVSFSSFRLIGISGSEAPELKAAAEQGCLVFCGGGRPRFQGERVQVADVARLQDGGAAPDQLARPTAHL